MKLTRFLTVLLGLWAAADPVQRFGRPDPGFVVIDVCQRHIVHLHGVVVGVAADRRGEVLSDPRLCGPGHTEQQHGSVGGQRRRGDLDQPLRADVLGRDDDLGRAADRAAHQIAHDGPRRQLPAGRPGTIVDVPKVPKGKERGCRTELVAEVDDADKLLDNWGGGALGASAKDYYASLHRVAYYGDHTRTIRHLAHLTGLEVVEEV